MARSNTGGTRGFLRGKIADDLYQVTKNARGRKIQIVKAYEEGRINPNTEAQAVARMQMALCMGSLSQFKALVDHSWETIPYGQLSIAHFVHVNMPLIQQDSREHWYAGSQFDYPTKGLSEVRLGPFIMSEGSLTLPEKLASQVISGARDRCYLQINTGMSVYNETQKKYYFLEYNEGRIYALDGRYQSGATAAGYNTTQFLPVNEGDKLIIRNVKTTSTFLVIAAYTNTSDNADVKKSVTGRSAIYEKIEYIVPAGINYIRTTIAVNQLPTFTFQKLRLLLGASAGDYITLIALYSAYAGLGTNGIGYVRAYLAQDISDDTVITNENVASMFTYDGNGGYETTLDISKNILIELIDPMPSWQRLVAATDIIISKWNGQNWCRNNSQFTPPDTGYEPWSENAAPDDVFQSWYENYDGEQPT